MVRVLVEWNTKHQRQEALPENKLVHGFIFYSPHKYFILKTSGFFYYFIVEGGFLGYPLIIFQGFERNFYLNFLFPLVKTVVHCPAENSNNILIFSRENIFLLLYLMLLFFIFYFGKAKKILLPYLGGAVRRMIKRHL